MIALLALLLALPARADDPPADTDTDASDTDDRGPEIIVYGDRIRLALDHLEQKLGTLGYRRGREANGRTTFVGDARWKPAVVIDHDGYLFFENHPVSWSGIEVRDGTDTMAASPVPSGPEPNPTLQTMPPAPTVVSKQTLAEKRTVDALKKRISEETRPEMDDLREVVYAIGLKQRLADLPGELEDIWTRGSDHGDELPDAAARRAALGALWASRTRTPEGEAVREAIAEYLENVVQPSKEPFTKAEIAHWSSVCGCEAGWAK